MPAFTGVRRWEEAERMWGLQGRSEAGFENALSDVLAEDRDILADVAKR